MSSPTLTILAGSNGAGRSTLTSSAREAFQGAPLLDPDAVARALRETLPNNDHSMEAGRRVLLRAEELIASRQSFTVETTLSGNTYLRMASRAKANGFLLSLIFIGTTSVEINIARVKARVLKGLHDVPEEDQRRRYPRTLANMARLLPLADVAILLDNSTAAGYCLVAAGHRESMVWTEPLPDWAKPLQALLP
ncbi:MAG: zeta toxin family protein [Acidobacteriaceae bacterium]|nr:zeta toxin family protein [Acidobacteriaceae bacterium]